MAENEIKHEREISIDIDEIIAKGKEGKLSTDEINEAVEEIDFDNDSLDKFYDALEDNEIPLDDISSSEMGEIESEVESEVEDETAIETESDVEGETELDTESAVEDESESELESELESAI